MVAMTLDWLPDPETLKTYAVHVGLSGALFTPAVIALFTCHYEPKGVINTQAEWVSMLVKWVQRDQVKTAGTNVSRFPGKPRSDEPFDDENTDWLHQEATQ